MRALVKLNPIRQTARHREPFFYAQLTAFISSLGLVLQQVLPQGWRQPV